MSKPMVKYEKEYVDYRLVSCKKVEYRFKGATDLEVVSEKEIIDDPVEMNIMAYEESRGGDRLKTEVN